MNLKIINDHVLIEKTIGLVREERELLTTVLHHLHEIHRRRLFSSLGYKSLFEFSVKHLGYSEDQAYRRISAMKLLKELPELEDKITQGEISLTHVGIAQSLFRQEKKIQNKDMSSQQKMSVLQQIANRPIREAERIALSLGSLQPQATKSDRIYSIAENYIELKFIASSELRQKLERLKGLLAHRYPQISLGELFEKLCDLGLHEWNPATVKSAALRKRCVKQQDSYAQRRRDVFQQAKNQCENCGSFYALEIDHIQPQALGGASTKENLRVLCRSCNQRAAIKAFGLSKMEAYL